MRLFKRKTAATDPAHTAELAKHKAINKETVNQAKGANAELKNLLDENHFTVKIVAAMGAHQRGGQTHHGR